MGGTESEGADVTIDLHTTKSDRFFKNLGVSLRKHGSNAEDLSLIHI